MGGIYLDYASDNHIIMNNIVNTDCGIRLDSSPSNTIKKNNFINNDDCNAFFLDSFRTNWNRNYWDDWDGGGSYRIKGAITIPIPDEPYYKLIDWYNFDWRPAKEPYDIPDEDNYGALQFQTDYQSVTEDSTSEYFNENTQQSSSQNSNFDIGIGGISNE